RPHLGDRPGASGGRGGGARPDHRLGAAAACRHRLHHRVPPPDPVGGVDPRRDRALRPGPGRHPADRRVRGVLADVGAGAARRGRRRPGGPRPRALLPAGSDRPGALGGAAHRAAVPGDRPAPRRHGGADPDRHRRVVRRHPRPGGGDPARLGRRRSGDHVRAGGGHGPTGSGGEPGFPGAGALPALLAPVDPPGGAGMRWADRSVALLRWLLLTATLPTLLVVIWWYASRDSTHFLFRPLSDIWAAFRQTWLGPRLVEDVLPSLSRLGQGYAASLLLGVGLGVLIGLHRTLRALVEPVLEFLRAIPPPALIPLIGLFAGLGDTRRVVIIIAGCVWPILLNTVEGVRAVDEVLTDTCRSYRIRGPRRLYHLVLRSASPQIMTGARQALAIGIILMVISELQRT